MTDAINDLAPRIQISDIRAEARRTPGTPMVLYLSGKHENGADCAACTRFEATQRSTLNANRNDVDFRQVQIPLTFPAFQELATSLGGTIDERGTMTFPGSHQ